MDLEDVVAELAAAEGFVEERVRAAMARLQGKYPPEVLAKWEDELRCLLLTHPVAKNMLARIRPRTDRSNSGDGVIASPAGLAAALNASKDEPR
ncbi:hypothetical protein A7982_13270 [Minicystis rosea]|nr:hypothetical protein A7982_13270 [Minicystis rosea]